jgi:uncharacterized repeat protein (TIGR01451 family)
MSAVVAMAVATIIPATANASPRALVGRAALPQAPGDDRLDDLEAASVTAVDTLDREPKVRVLAEGTAPQTFLIRLRDDALPTYTGGLSGLPRTAPRAGRQLNAQSAASRLYLDHLVEAQVEFVSRMERATGRQVEVPFTYQFAVNGVAAVLTPAEASAVAQDPAVVSISADQERELHTDAGPRWSNADALWNAVAELGLPANVNGEGVVIGTIDTGISPGNQSFADPAPGDGFDHTNPLGAGTYLGVCNPANPANAGGFDPNFPCNDKLIGAYVFGGANPNGNSALDYDGHGSHTSSTSGGNVLNDVIVESPTITTPPFDISGVAPHANVVSYLACCTLAGLTAAIDQAIADEVDVINYSIGSSAPSALWDDFDTVGFLNARAAGIFVATSNGNDGPGVATTGSPADAPWITSAGASTHNRHNANALTGLTSSNGPLADIPGKSVTGALTTPTPIVYAGAFGDPFCGQTTGNQANFTGRIVICDRGGDIGRVQKSANVAAQGAVGFVLANDSVHGKSLQGDEYALPGVFINFDDGQALKTWVGTGTGHVGTIAGTTFVVDDQFGDIMASFSSRGPNRAIETVVPAVTAPGVDVLAAVGAESYTSNLHGFISGTSMASPHVAGAGALLTQARPDWSPAQQQSALMTTARPTVLNHTLEPATPYAQGSGHIDIGAAARAGLLFDESFADYVAANPEEGGDPKTLNLASFANFQCLVECSWTRTATVPVNAAGPVPAGVTWTASTVTDPGLSLDVSLSAATLSPGDSTTIDVSADVAGAPADVTLFGRITLTPDNPAVPTVTMPVAVVPTSGVLPDAVDVTTRRNAGSHPVTDIESIAVTDFAASVLGLVPGTIHEGALVQDPTNGTPYDDLDQVDVFLLDVPAGATRLVAETLTFEMGDADLFVGTGGTPSLATEVCASTSPTAKEFCDVPDPAPGTWWVLLQNWEGSTPTAVDAYTLATAVVPGEDVGNAGIEGPSGPVPNGQPYDVRFHWDEPEMAAGDVWYGTAVLGSSPATIGDIGSFPVTVRRVEDDVAKTASVAEARAGDPISYEITVQPNVTVEDRVYTITDTVPDGLTIDPASVTGGGVVDGQTITWEVESLSPFTQEFNYEASTPATNPQCAEWGGFIDLGAPPINIPLNPALDGDTTFGTTFANIGPFEQYGQEFPALTVSEDGITTVAGGFGGSPWVPQAIPNAAAPNGVFAPLWSDLELSVADGRGMRLASNAGLGAAIVQWDDPFEFTSTPTIGPSVGKFQAWIYNAVADFRPEATFEYAALGALPASATIGIENILGDQATALVGAGDPSTVLSAPGTICLDYVGPELAAITVGYSVTVDADATPGTSTNAAVHVTDDPFAQPATASADVEILPIEAPSAPRDLQAVAGNRSVALSWTAPESDGGASVTDYVIQRATRPNGPWTTVNDGVSTNTSFTVAGLFNGVEYFFRVAAVNSAGTGPFSDVVSATPATVPKAPRHLKARPAGAGAIKLAWSKPWWNGGAPITDYVIQYSTRWWGPWTTVDDGVSTSRRYTVTGLADGTRYFFRVAAVNSAGTGPFSDVESEKTATVPRAPKSLKARGANRSVRLEWSKPWWNGGASITDYVIQYSTRWWGPWTTVDDGTSTSRKSTVRDLTNGTRYYFRVAATNAVGTGPWSDVEDAKPRR